jgi:hypothetical protein
MKGRNNGEECHEISGYAVKTQVSNDLRAPETAVAGAASLLHTFVHNVARPVCGSSARSWQQSAAEP